MKKRIISMLLTLVMVVSLVACSNPAPKETTSADDNGTSAEATTGESEEATTEEVKKDPVTITLMPANANLTSGVVGGWLGEYLAEHGIILEIWAYSADKVNAILTGGDYPDIMYFSNKVDLNVLAEEGALLDLSQYMDRLPALEKYPEFKTAVSYIQNYVTDETDKLVVLPTGVGEGAAKLNTGGASLSINWELYEKIGSPEIKTWEDTIDVFKKMQAEWPVSDTGIKTYAMHLYGGADNGYFKGIDNVMRLSGYSTGWCKWFLAGNTNTNEFDYLLEDDGIYKYALKYYNTLYREGLLDPDSITYDRKTVISIVDTEGSTLAGWPCVPAYEKKGFMPLYFEDLRIMYNSTSKPYGGSAYIGVSAKCENIDAALELLNLFTDPDSALIIKNGPQGELWDFDASGVPVLTEKGYNYYVNGEPVTINGETFSYFNTTLMPNNGVLTSYGKAVIGSSWPEVIGAANETDIIKRWKNHYKTTDLKELLGDDLVTLSHDQNLAYFVENPTEEEDLLFAAAQDIIIQASWQMVYAEDDAAFEKIWDDAVAECEALGIKKLVEARKEALSKAVEVRDELEK